MREYIKKLQSKSEGSRKQLLVVWMVVSMVIVGSVWIYGLTDRLGAKTSAQAREDIKPFTLFGDSVSNLVQNLRASAGNISFSKTEDKSKDTGKQIDLIPVEYSNN